MKEKNTFDITVEKVKEITKEVLCDLVKLFDFVEMKVTLELESHFCIMLETYFNSISYALWSGKIIFV